jgi:hypothetical protein
MADINGAAGDGTIRFEDGGVLEIGADTVLQIVAGSIQEEPGGRMRYPERDRGKYTGSVTERGQRESVVRFSLKITSSTFTANEIEDILNAVPASGDDVGLLTIAVTYANQSDATAGIKRTYTNCYLPNPARVRTSGSNEPDMLEFVAHSLNQYPTKTTVA